MTKHNHKTEEQVNQYKTVEDDLNDDLKEETKEATTDVSEQLKKLTSENESLKDLMQRRQADFENYKKRMLKQFEDNRKYALKDIAEDIILVNDDLLRAIDAASAVTEEAINAETYSSMLKGIEMISKKIEEALSKHGIVEIEAQNCAFDPNVHEAYEIETSDDIELDMVSKVHQKGFKIDDVIIRTSKVKVAKPSKKD